MVSPALRRKSVTITHSSATAGWAPRAVIRRADARNMSASARR